jgi:hypothetical protein
MRGGIGYWKTEAGDWRSEIGLPTATAPFYCQLETANCYCYCYFLIGDRTANCYCYCYFFLLTANSQLTSLFLPN